MAKIGILMGKGVEGCGVTKYALEMVDYLHKSDDEYKLFIVEDKSFARKNSHDFSKYEDNIIRFRTNRVKDKDQLASKAALEVINQMDHMIILSLPTKSYPQSTIDQVRFLIENINPNVKLTYTHHNHSSHFLSRECLLDWLIPRLDMLFVHSNVNPLIRRIQKQFEPKVFKTYTLNPSIDVDKLKEKYWTPIMDQKVDETLWIGRTTPLKGYDLYMSMHDEYFRDAGFTSSLYGMDRGPAFIGFKQNWKDKYVAHIDVNADTYNEDNLANVYGPYNAHEVLTKASKLPFIFQLTKFRDSDFDKSFSLEFSHIEACCVGSVPIFRKEYGEQCISRVSSKPIIEEDHGILYLSEDNKEEIFQKVARLQDDPEEREVMRNKAFKFIKSQSDSSVVFKEFFDRVKSYDVSNLKGIKPIE